MRAAGWMVSWYCGWWAGECSCVGLDVPALADCILWHWNTGELATSAQDLSVGGWGLLVPYVTTKATCTLTILSTKMHILMPTVPLHNANASARRKACRGRHQPSLAPDTFNTHARHGLFGSQTYIRGAFDPQPGWS